MPRQKLAQRSLPLALERYAPPQHLLALERCTSPQELGGIRCRSWCDVAYSGCWTDALNDWPWCGIPSRRPREAREKARGGRGAEKGTFWRPTSSAGFLNIHRFFMFRVQGLGLKKD